MTLVPIPVELPEAAMDLLKTLAGPAADELGLALRDSVRMWRLKRQARFLRRVEEICTEANIKPQAVRLPLVFDILDRASLEESDDLQDLWANLLSNAANPREEALVTTAFPEILKQLSKEEAVYLKELAEIEAKTEANILSAYVAEMGGGEIPPSKLEAIYLDNLKRLGLIQAEPEFIPAAATHATPEELSSGAKREYEPLTDEIYRVTALGAAFVKACSNPMPKTATVAATT